MSKFFWVPWWQQSWKLINGGVLIRISRCAKNQKINKRWGNTILDSRVPALINIIFLKFILPFSLLNKRFLSKIQNTVYISYNIHICTYIITIKQGLYRPFFLLLFYEVFLIPLNPLLTFIPRLCGLYVNYRIWLVYSRSLFSSNARYP